MFLHFLFLKDFYFNLPVFKDLRPEWRTNNYLDLYNNAPSSEWIYLSCIEEM